MADPFKIYKTAKNLYKLSKEFGKRNFSQSEKKVQDYATQEYTSARVHMSEPSASEYAKNSTREKFNLDFGGKPKVDSKNLGGGVSSGPPPKRGPNPQVPPVKLSTGGCPYRQSSKKNIYPGHNGIQLKGQKFRGVR
jgi:hypothetical protein